MNRFRTQNAALAVALSAGLMFVAGGAMAQDQEPTNTDRMAAADSEQPVNDTWITTKVKSSLVADSDVAGTDIRVVTTNGVVALSGHVESQAQIDKALEIAQEIEGVVRVDHADLVVGTAHASN